MFFVATSFSFESLQKKTQLKVGIDPLKHMTTLLLWYLQQAIIQHELWTPKLHVNFANNTFSILNLGKATMGELRFWRHVWISYYV